MVTRDTATHEVVGVRATRQGRASVAHDLLPSRHRRPASTAAKPLRFTFDGKTMQGFAGDTLASALLANGRMLVGRSFKYHRPRGILTAGSAEPNALSTIGSGGRTRAEHPRDGAGAL